MAVTVENLYNKNKDMDITLIAGENGLKNIVRWVHMVETVEISTFLESNEVAFITGVGLSKEGELFELIKSIQKNEGSAVVVNYGPFIKAIPEEILDYCNDHGLPLFTVPWSVHMAEIMRRCCLMITMTEKMIMEISTAFRNAIFFPKERELYVPHFESNGFKVTDAYVMACVYVKGKKSEDDMGSRDDQAINKIVKYFDNYLSYMEIPAVVFEVDNNIVIAFINNDEDKVQKILKRLKKEQTSRELADNLYMGIGDKAIDAYGIHKSYRHAKKVMELNVKTGQDNYEVAKYQDMGVYRLLMDIEDPATLKEYYNETIGNIVAYDKMNNGDLAIVLRAYLENNGSIQQTAEQMFIHRNTVNYKIRKIEELLDIDLSETSSRVNLDIGFKVADILNVKL